MRPSRLVKLASGAVDAGRLLSPPDSGPSELTWPVSTEDRRRIEVWWPKEYEWGNAAHWVLPIRHGMERLVPLVERDIPQRAKMVTIKIKLDGRLHDVIIDYHDVPECDSAVLDQVALYFKMQCPPDADHRVVPGGFVPRSEQIYYYLRRIRRLRDQREYAFDVYGRFGMTRSGISTEVRRKAAAMLSSQTGLRYAGGSKLVGYPSYLREIARARVCIDLPGLGPLCFRQMDYLAVGACIIGPRPRVVLPVQPVDRCHVVYAKDDLSDLVELCEEYLGDEKKREVLVENARSYFDRYIHRYQLGAYYLHTALKRLPPDDTG